MYRKLGATALLLAGGLIALNARDRAATDAALERAAFAWDRGDYVAALTTYQELLAGPDAATVLEPIALQTGELFVTTELTTDGANPVFAPDSRYFSFETGAGVVAGVASGLGPRDARPRSGRSRERRDDAGRRRRELLPRRPSRRLPARAALARRDRAQAALAAAAGGRRKNARRVSRRWRGSIARAGRIVVRDLGANADEVLNTGDLLKTGVTCAADGAVLFGGARGNDTAATQIYAATAAAGTARADAGRRLQDPLEDRRGRQARCSSRSAAGSVPRGGRAGPAAGAGPARAHPAAGVIP